MHSNRYGGSGGLGARLWHLVGDSSGNLLFTSPQGPWAFPPILSPYFLIAKHIFQQVKLNYAFIYSMLTLLCILS